MKAATPGIEDLYRSRLDGDSHHDMREHLPILRRYSERSLVVVEFGVRTGNSTVAFLAGGASVASYDVAKPTFECPEDAYTRWTFTQADTATLGRIPECDFLFLDSLHTSDHVRAELRMHIHVRRFIGFHDTMEWGIRGENGALGILFAILPFLAENKNEWRIAEHRNNCCGLTIIERVTPN